MKRIAIIAALAGELRPLVGGWHRQSRRGVELWRSGAGEAVWVAACAGIGMEAAERAWAAIGCDGPIDLVLSTGWAGALRPEIAAGRAYGVSGVVDARTGETFPAAGGCGDCLLVTSRRVADQAEKRRLAAACGAALVDMEAAAVARLAAERGVPFYCIKGVSDAFAAGSLPDFNRFVAANGAFSPWRLARFALVRPWHWRALGRMGAQSRTAARAIGESIRELLAFPPRGRACT